MGPKWKFVTVICVRCKVKRRISMKRLARCGKGPAIAKVVYSTKKSESERDQNSVLGDTRSIKPIVHRL